MSVQEVSIPENVFVRTRPTFPISETPLHAVFLDANNKVLWQEQWVFKNAMGVGEIFIRNYIEFKVTGYDRTEDTLFFRILRIRDTRKR